jgi:epoxyqueuosine reductase
MVGSTKEEILLHVCCAPCSTHVLNILSQIFSVTAFYYNPNIQPEEEYTKRLTEIRRLCVMNGTKLLIPDYDGQSWSKSIQGLESEPEGGKRCRACFEIRLQKTAETALRQGITKVATTLTISPHKNSQIINESGKIVARKTGIIFLDCDFKQDDGYRKSCELSRTYGLYRQRYCGCLFSIR